MYLKKFHSLERRIEHKNETDVETITQVIKNNYDWYVKGYNGKSREQLTSDG